MVETWLVLFDAVLLTEVVGIWLVLLDALLLTEVVGSWLVLFDALLLMEVVGIWLVLFDVLLLTEVVGSWLVLFDALLLMEAVDTLPVEVARGTVTVIVCVTMPPVAVIGGGDWVSKQEQPLLAAVLGHETLKDVQ